jgi:hypothetical protein
MDRIVQVSRSTWMCESDRTHQNMIPVSDGYASLYPSYGLFDENLLTIQT